MIKVLKYITPDGNKMELKNANIPLAISLLLPKDKLVMPKALTAENGAKALLIGEFKEPVVVPCGECVDVGDINDDCTECGGSGYINSEVTVSWTTIKEIYAMAVKYFEDEK